MEHVVNAKLVQNLQYAKNDADVILKLSSMHRTNLPAMYCLGAFLPLLQHWMCWEAPIRVAETPDEFSKADRAAGHQLEDILHVWYCCSSVTLHHTYDASAETAQPLLRRKCFTMTQLALSKPKIPSVSRIYKKASCSKKEKKQTEWKYRSEVSFPPTGKTIFELTKHFCREVFWQNSDESVWTTPRQLRLTWHTANWTEATVSRCRLVWTAACRRTTCAVLRLSVACCKGCRIQPYGATLCPPHFPLL